MGAGGERPEPLRGFGLRDGGARAASCPGRRGQGRRKTGRRPDPRPSTVSLASTGPIPTQNFREKPHSSAWDARPLQARPSRLHAARSSCSEPDVQGGGGSPGAPGSQPPVLSPLNPRPPTVWLLSPTSRKTLPPCDGHMRG
ncbi:hypothetical protein CapIbe_004184 [Capra ibex]